jgi:signal transduction histidine kinase
MGVALRKVEVGRGGSTPGVKGVDRAGGSEIVRGGSAQSEIGIPSSPVDIEGNRLRGDCELTNFIDGATHDLHTPLNVIIGFCYLLEHDPESPLTPGQRDIIARMKRNARALLENANALLARLRADSMMPGDRSHYPSLQKYNQ